MVVSENKNVKICCLNDEEVAMSLLLVPDLVATSRIEVDVNSDVELNVCMVS